MEQGGVHPSCQDGTNLIVNYIPHNIDDDSLKALFIEYGEIVNAKLIKDKYSKKSLGYGFVKFVKFEDAQAAIESKNGFWMGYKKLKVSIARPACEEIKNCKLYITNLPKDYCEDDVIQVFQEFGTIIECRVIKERGSEYSKGIAFVQFSLKHEAQQAMSMHGYQIPGNEKGRLTVKYSDDQYKKQNQFAGKAGGGVKATHSRDIFDDESSDAEYYQQQKQQQQQQQHRNQPLQYQFYENSHQPVHMTYQQFVKQQQKQQQFMQNTTRMPAGGKQTSTHSQGRGPALRSDLRPSANASTRTQGGGQYSAPGTYTQEGREFGDIEYDEEEDDQDGLDGDIHSPSQVAPVAYSRSAKTGGGAAQHGHSPGHPEQQWYYPTHAPSSPQRISPAAYEHYVMRDADRTYDAMQFVSSTVMNRGATVFLRPSTSPMDECGYSGSVTLTITNLPSHTDVALLYDMVAPYGRVLSAQIDIDVRHMDGGSSGNYGICAGRGYVQIEGIQQAQYAVQALHGGMFFENRLPLQVSYHVRSQPITMGASNLASPVRAIARGPSEGVSNLASPVRAIARGPSDSAESSKQGKDEALTTETQKSATDVETQQTASREAASKVPKSAAAAISSEKRDIEVRIEGTESVQVCK